MDTRLKYGWTVLAVLFAACITYFMWPLLVTHPGQLDMELGGDGSKNFFTFLYHSMYGKGIWFDGMNYPYGEHIVYVDGQPILSVTIAYLRDMVHFTLQDIVAILHLMMVFSFFLAIVYTYKILRAFGVVQVLAIIFAGFIITLSPQVFRVFGHFGLSYFCVIPMIFLWTIRYHRVGHWQYPLYIFVAGLIASFLHPYFGAVVLIWAGFYMVGYYIFNKDTLKKKLRHLVPLFISVISVFISIKLLVALTDPATDRPITPIGVLSNGTTGEDVFFSHLSPIWRFINENIYGIELRILNEGYAYIGFVTSIVLLLLVISVIRKRIVRKKAEPMPSRNHFEPVWLFIGIAALLLGMGVPFVWHMEWLLDYITVFKQFRSLGRFSWIFYYVITVFAAVKINDWFLNTWVNKKVLAISGLAACVLLSGIDSFGYFAYARDRAGAAPGNYTAFFFNDNWTQLLSKHGYKTDSFQALLLLPFYHVGTEKFTLNPNQDWALTLAMRASIEMHLPIVDAMMSRSSWTQAAAQARLLGGPMTNKPILEASTKPFLLIYNMQTPEIDGQSDYLLQAADFIDSISIFKVYACYPGRIKAHDKQVRDSINQYVSNVSSGDTCIGCSSPYFVEHFDMGKSSEKFFGEGAAEVIEKDEEYVAEFRFLDTLVAAEKYEFSSWILVSQKDYKTPYFILDIFDVRGNIMVREEFGLRPVDSYSLWFRLSKFVNLPSGTAMVKCLLVNKDGPTYTAMDELMLKPANATVISKLKDGSVMVDNHIFKK